MPIEPSPSWPHPLPGSGRDAVSALTASPPAHIFREYDVRGLVDAPHGYDASRITPFTAEVLGRAFGTLLHAHDVRQVVVGHDSRAYAPVLTAALVQGLLATGREVVAIGSATTPLVYFAQHHLDVTGAVAVTASHNPNGWGGFKLSTAPSTTLGPEGITELHAIADAGRFRRGVGAYVERSVTADYVEHLAATNPAPAPLRLVVDGANSISGVLAQQTLAAAGYRATAINEELDWSFPNHEPDPELVAGRQQLAEAVLATGADVGLALDGDGDRLGVTDERGRTVWADRVLALLALDVLERHPGATIVYDVKCSRLVAEVVRANGGDPVMAKTGHSHVKAKMRELGAPFAGERSGHFFNAVDHLGFDDAIHAALRLAALRARRGEPISSLVGDLPHYESSPTIQAPCADEAKYAVVERFREEAVARADPSEVVTINGVRLEFEDGWSLVRASSNVPGLVVVCEGRTTAALHRHYRLVREILDSFPEVDPVWENDLESP